MVDCETDPTNSSCTCSYGTKTKVEANSFGTGHPPTNRYICQTPCKGDECLCDRGNATNINCKCTSPDQPVYITKGSVGTGDQANQIDYIACCPSYGVDTCESVGWTPNEEQDAALTRKNEKEGFFYRRCNSKADGNTQISTISCPSGTGYPRAIKDSKHDITSEVSDHTCFCLENPNDRYNGA